MDCQYLADRLVGWVREQVLSAGCKGVVLGMRGGLDSSVAAVLCQRAFPEDVLGVIMPCYSCEEDAEHARKQAEKARRELERANHQLELSAEKADRVTASGGVSESPLDGANLDEILEKAKEALAKAKQKGKNKVVSAGV